MATGNIPRPNIKLKRSTPKEQINSVLGIEDAITIKKVRKGSFGARENELLA